MKIKTPYVAADTIIKFQGGIVLINRENPPHGWAIPGGLVDYGESVEAAAIREAKEETNLDVEIESLLGVYSEPGRDPRMHCVTISFICTGKGELKPGDDAAEAKVFKLDEIPDLVFDHNKIIEDFKKTNQL